MSFNIGLSFEFFWAKRAFDSFFVAFLSMKFEFTFTGKSFSTNITRKSICQFWIMLLSEIHFHPIQFQVITLLIR